MPSTGRSCRSAPRWVSAGDGQRCRLWFQLRPGSYNAAGLIGFLRDLKKHLRRQSAILIWDGLPAHKSREMRTYLESQKSWLSVEMLPGYSPDLNPVEDLWGNVKGQELANRCVEGLADAEAALRSGLQRVRRSKLPLLFPASHRASFLTHVVTLLCEIQ